MDVLLSAVASDLVGRLVSFLIRKCQEPTAADDIGRLQRALLRARIVVEEAEERQVTNQAMLLQLTQLRGEMCRAYYGLDTSIVRATTVASHRHRRRRRQPLLTLLDSLGGSRPREDAMGRLAVVESLEAALSDAKELVVLLSGCPRLTRQPYSAYLFMERCMFGRQMEKEQIVDFLLRPACSSSGDRNLWVLPVVGGREVGKRTLVEYVCIDERVTQHYAKIHRLSSDDLTAGNDDREDQRIDPSGRSLVVVDLVGDVDEESWRRLCSSIRRANGDSKVVVICRTEEHASLGTAPPVVLRMLRRHELWYFFRALAFGAGDPEGRPELVSIAAEIFAWFVSAAARDLELLPAVNILAASLRADLSARSWRRIARVLCEGFGGREPDPEKRKFRICSPASNAPPFVIHHWRKWTPASLTRRGGEQQIPKVRMHDLIAGGVIPSENTPRFDVLEWQSPIPPYYSYIATCEMEKGQKVVMAPKKKRLQRKRPAGNWSTSPWLKKKKKSRTGISEKTINSNS